MDPIICASAPSYQSFPWPPEPAVMQAAIRNPRMHWTINAVASRKNPPFVSG